MLLGKYVSFNFFFFFFSKKIPQIKFDLKFKGDHGFGTVCKIDAGYYSQGFFLFFSFFIFQSF